MKWRYELGSASIVAWLALFSNVLAEASTAPVDTREPAVAVEGVQASAHAHDDDAATVQPPESTALRPAQNSVFLELLGSSILYSVNYERVLFGQVAVRVGLSPLFSSSTGWLFSAPVTVTYVGLGGFETGVGVTLMSERAPFVTTLAGYRLHPRGGAGFQLRMGGMVIMGQGVAHFSRVVPWTYLSVGAGF
jgi:hypothetical protein